MSLRGASYETQLCVAASRKRPDKHWQGVFWSRKDAQPSWYHQEIWKLPTLSHKQVAELADGNDFIPLKLIQSGPCCVFCLLLQTTTSDTPSMCSVTKWLLFQAIPPYPSDTPDSFQSWSHPTAHWQLCLQASPFLMAVEGITPSSESALVNVLAS